MYNSVSALCSRREFVKLASVVAGASSMLALTACGPAAEESAQKPAEKKTNAAETLGDGKVLRVGMEAAYAPYNWQVSEASGTTIPIDNVPGAHADGYDVQVAKKIAEAFGMEAVAVKMSFGGLVDALTNGQIDIICAGMSATPERAQSIDFSVSYLDDDIVLVVKKDSKYASATKLDDFAGAAVLGQKDTMFDDVIESIPSVNHLTPVATVPNVVENLLNGTCDAITFSKMSLPSILKDNADLVVVDFNPTFSDGLMPANAGVAKGHEAALTKVNQVIEAISATERQQIWDGCMERQPA